ncbi:MAG: hypothetical protein M1829_004933 [Trizodia sp. TS-e1964]|nr:MAG: hypothetical protein M1829_004933 [Trizodia sp. TS-e1964]
MISTCGEGLPPHPHILSPANHNIENLPDSWRSRNSAARIVKHPACSPTAQNAATDTDYMEIREKSAVLSNIPAWRPNWTPSESPGSETDVQFTKVSMGRTDSGYSDCDGPFGQQGNEARDAVDQALVPPLQRHEDAGAPLSDNQHQESPALAELSRVASPSSAKRGSPSRPSTAQSQSQPRRRRSTRTSSSRPDIHRLKSTQSYNGTTMPRRLVHSSSRSIPSRRSSVNDDRENPIAFHYKSCHLFQSLGASFTHQNGAPGVGRTALAGADVPSPPQSQLPPSNSTLAYQQMFVGQPLHEEEAPVPPPSPPPATITHWLSHNTRRREYAEIDRTTRGLRGWWRRIAPSCFVQRRLGFYDSENSSDDKGSVRRYRLDLPDDEEGTMSRGKRRGLRGRLSCMSLASRGRKAGEEQE